MKKHLTQNQLIKYRFALSSEELDRQAGEHLAGCPRCRRELKQLDRKFASLDLLAGPADVDPQLIEKLTRQTTEPAKRKRNIRRTFYFSAAATILIAASIAAVFMFSYQPRDAAEQTPGKIPEGEITALPVAAKPPAGEMPIDAAGIPEKPPFAPASAIELVTLPRRDNVQLTIYNSADLTLVREKRNLTLKKGWNWLQFMWANTLIDPTSLSLEPLQDSDKIDIKQLVFPARLKDIGRWLIRSETEGQVPFEVTYFTSGLNWRAFYTGTLSPDERKMKLQGYVRVANNSGEDYENAQTRLIVGKVHQLDKIVELAKRQYPYNMPGIKRDISDSKGISLNWKDGKVPLLGDVDIGGELFDCDSRLRRKEIKKEGLSEYFLYTIEGTETIPDKWGKRLLSFDVADIDVNSLYKYDERRWGKQTIRFISFANDEDHNLGDTPIPNGNVKIYSQVEDTLLSYTGGTDIKYIPVNEDVELNLGPARLVSVKPVLMDEKTENYVFDSNDNIAGFERIRTWKIKAANRRFLPINVEITRGFGTAYRTLQMNRGQEVSYEKYDATHARFKAKLQPQSKRTFTYTVRTYHGRREEYFTKIKNKKSF